jgi:hypothetical protein
MSRRVIQTGKQVAQREQWDGQYSICYQKRNSILLNVSKIEPSEFVNYKHESSIKQFLQIRIISTLGFNQW